MSDKIDGHKEDVEVSSDPIPWSDEPEREKKDWPMETSDFGVLPPRRRPAVTLATGVKECLEAEDPTDIPIESVRFTVVRLCSFCVKSIATEVDGAAE